MKRLIYILLLGVIMTSSFVQVGHARSAGFPSKLELKVGETKTVTVEYEGYTDHSFAPTTNGVIDVNISGRTAYVTGLRTGTGYIAVNVWRWYIGSTERDIVHFLCEVTVTEPDPSSINLSSTSISLKEGETMQLSASVLPDNAPQGISWSIVSGSSVASVSSSGLVTAKALGTATVRATSIVKSSVYRDCSVTVTAGDGILLFADKEVKRMCVANWDTNGDGELSKAEAAAVTKLERVFYHEKDITSFNELKYFTGLTIIDAMAFYGCSSLTSITLPNSVTLIDIWAFSGCSSLKSIIIPNSVTNIESWAFDGCSSLTSITIPNSVTNIEKDALSNSAWYDKQPNGMVYAGKVAYKYKGEMPEGTKIVIKDGTLGIAACAFSGCRGLTSVTIPSCVINIGKSAFEGCSSLTSVIIPNSVTNIRRQAFRNCSSLTSITIPNSVISIGAFAFLGTAWYDKQPDGMVYAGKVAYGYKGTMPEGTEIVIKDGTLGIADEAFSGCSGLTSIIIPKSVIRIHYLYSHGSSSSLSSIIVESGNRFYDSRGNCNAIVETSTNTLIAGCMNTIIPESVTSIGSNAFNGHDGLTSVTIPNSVTSIGNYAFFGCSGLTSVTIGSGVTSIERAFECCNGLADIYCYAENVPTTDEYAFNNSPIASATLHVPAGSVEAYKTTEPWSGFGTIVANIPFADAKVKALCVANWDNNNDGEIDIEEAAAVTNLKEVFRGNKEIKSFDELQFFTGLKNIDKNAFYLCSSLTSIAIPESVTSIDYGAFWGCRSLTAITIPNGVTRIGNFAFLNCDGLTSITIPESVTSIGVGIFESCDGLTSIVVESENAVYDSRDNCNAIIELSTNRLIAGCKNTNIPGSVTTIGQYAFSGCSGLTSITIPNSVTSIDDFAFWECDGLTSITIPESVTSIGIQSFRYCRSLKSVTIGNGVTSIGICAFGECKNLTSLNIPSSVTSIDDSAFYGCSCLTSVTIPTSVFSIGKNPFYDCKGITSFNVEQGNIHYDSRDNCNAIIETSSNTLISGCRNTNIPKSVTSIGDDAFYGCSGLTSVTIPNSVTSIGKYAFYGCSGLTSVLTNREQPIPIQSGHFSNRENATLYVPHGSSAAYKAAEVWCEFKEIVDCMEGDVNLDENTDVVDVVDIARFVVGMPSESFMEIFADINKDGSVNLADAVAVVNSIVGEQNFVKPLVAPEGIDRDDDLTLVEGGGCLSLNLGNTRYYTAFQFDLHLPQGVDLDVIALNAKRKQGHQLLYNKVEDGHYRVAALSTNNSTFAGNEGELLNIVLAGVPEDKVNIRNIHFFDADGNDYLFDDLESTVATNLNSPVPSDQKGEIYDLYGRKRTMLQHGINISGGKKILVR